MAYWVVKRGLLQCKRRSFGVRKTVFCYLYGVVVAWCGRLLSLFAYLVYPFGYVFEDFGRDGFFYLSVFDGEAGGACLEQVVEAGVGLYGV